MNLGHHLDGPESAPALVLSSSLGTTAALWEPQLPPLVERFRVLRYDHPGHGRSAVPDEPVTVEALARGVLELLDRLGLERVSFCGLSLGGMVGMALTLEAPERVGRLVLCCTAACLGPPEAWRERARLVRARGPSAVAEAVIERWFTSAFRAAHSATVDRFREMLEATPREGYAACCEAVAAWDARERIHAIQAPTLVIVGAEDPATTSEHASLMANEIAGARIAVLPDAAHLANVEQPALFNRALLDHLAERSAEAAA